MAFNFTSEASLSKGSVNLLEGFNASAGSAQAPLSQRLVWDSCQRLVFSLVHGLNSTSEASHSLLIQYNFDFRRDGRVVECDGLEIR